MISVDGADWVPAREWQVQHEMFKLAKPTDLTRSSLDLCYKRLPSNQQHCRDSVLFFKPLCLSSPHWCCTATHMCRNIYYPSSFIVPAFSCPVTALLSSAEVCETSQRLTAACTCQLSNLSLFWHILRGTLCGHLDKYNSSHTSGKMGVFLGLSVGNEGCTGFQGEVCM